jgi:biotin carboxyl carrier protein
MKYLINGTEWEPTGSTDAEVFRLPDRLAVRTKDGTATALAVRSGSATYVSYRGRTFKIERGGRRRAGAHGEANGESRAPMPGQIVEVSVKAGDTVAAGDRLLVLEAMKMQQPVVASVAGRVKSVAVSVGSQVAEGEILVVVEEPV